MTIGDLAGLLAQELGAARIVATEGTGMFLAAGDNLVMVRAYLDDGRTFFLRGDRVNALAAGFYGEGWLHCGAAIGFFSIAAPRCMFDAGLVALPREYSEKLQEKTARYERLLETARASVRPAAETGTPLFGMADRIAVVAGAYAHLGGRFRSHHECEVALACFSYGHGWIDAAVRAGLFCVTGSREIFTL